MILFTQIVLNSKIISKLSFSNHHDLQESCRQQTCHPSSFPQVPAVTKIYPQDSKDLKTKIPKTNPYDSSKGQIFYHSELILLCKKTISPFLKMNPSRIGKSYHPQAKVIIHRQELSSIGKSYHSKARVIIHRQELSFIGKNYHPQGRFIIHRQKLSSSYVVGRTAVNAFTSLQIIMLLKVNVVENVDIINQRIPIMIFMPILYFLRANSACPEGSREWVTT